MIAHKLVHDLALGMASLESTMDSSYTSWSAICVLRHHLSQFHQAAAVGERFGGGVDNGRNLQNLLV